MKTALKVIAVIVLAVTLPYTTVLLVLPVTFLGMSMPFKVPDSVIGNPYLGRAIALTFGFLATALFLRFVIRWKWFEGKILAFGGVVAVFVAWNLFMWWMTMAPTRAEKAMGVLRQQNKTQQTAIARFEDSAKELRAKVGSAEGAKASCDGRVVQLQQTLAAKEQMLTSKAQDSKALAEADAQSKQDLTQCRGDMETLRTQSTASTEACLLANETIRSECAASKKNWQAQLDAAQAECTRLKHECQQSAEALRRQLDACLVSANDQPACAQASGASFQPAVYSPPPVARPSPAPKPKAKIVVLKQFYNYMYAYGGLFDLALVEKNGVPVVFDRMSISIWQRNSTTQPIDEVKQGKPAVFERSGFEIAVSGNSKPTEFKLTLAGYEEWLNNDEWVEIALFGTDANGYSHTLTFAGAD